MKKLFVVIIVMFQTSCISTSSDGGLNVGFQGGPLWLKTSSEKDKQEYFNEIDVSKLCQTWKETTETMEDTNNKSKYARNQNAQFQIMKGLKQKGYNKNHCGEPNLMKFAPLEEKWVNVETNEYGTPKAKQAFTLCDAKADLAEIQAKNTQESLNNQQKGTGIALSIVQGLNVVAAGNDAYQSVLKGCMADKGYLKQKVRITVD